MTTCFLTKIGVPIKTTAYFMNQPIVRDYLRTVESAGYSWLFIDNFALDILGFDSKELNALLEPEVVVGLTDEDDAPALPEEPITKLGDIYQLGKHRLMCGDSTSIDAVDQLMNGTKVDMLFTDPPYNVGFNGRSGKHDVIKNDNLSDSDFENFIAEVCNTIKAIDPKVYYIWCNWNFYGILQGKLDYKTCIVWAKNVFGMGNGYRHQHEFCLTNSGGRTIVIFTIR